VNAVELLDRARSAGVELWRAGEKLRYRGPADAVAGLLPTIREHRPALLAALAQPARPDPAETSGHWMIVQAQRTEHWFAPPATRAELEARYPGAMLVALPESPEDARPATKEEAAEIGRVVDAVAAREGFGEEEKVEAIANALRDADNALRCFRRLLNVGRT